MRDIQKKRKKEETVEIVEETGEGGYKKHLYLCIYIYIYISVERLEVWSAYVD